MTHRPVHETEPIPERPSWPMIGHALDVPSGVDGLLHVMAEARELGQLYKLRIFDREINFVSGLDLVAELSDETRFRKNLHPDLVLLRDIGGDGLFTAYNDEPNWRKAHDILMYAFSLGAMRGYHSTMLDVARTLIAKWDSAVGATAVDVAEDMTRLTFDTIGLCGFGYDFESFSREEAHPFVTALSRALDFAQTKGEALPWTGLFQWKRAEQYHEDLAYMKDLVDEVSAVARPLGTPASTTCSAGCCTPVASGPARRWTTSTSATRRSPSSSPVTRRPVERCPSRSTT